MTLQSFRASLFSKFATKLHTRPPETPHPDFPDFSGILQESAFQNKKRFSVRNRRGGVLVCPPSKKGVNLVFRGTLLVVGFLQFVVRRNSCSTQPPNGCVVHAGGGSATGIKHALPEFCYRQAKLLGSQPRQGFLLPRIRQRRCR